MYLYRISSNIYYNDKAGDSDDDDTDELFDEDDEIIKKSSHASLQKNKYSNSQDPQRGAAIGKPFEGKTLLKHKNLDNNNKENGKNVKKNGSSNQAIDTSDIDEIIKQHLMEEESQRGISKKLSSNRDLQNVAQSGDSDEEDTIGEEIDYDDKVGPAGEGKVGAEG